jgi:two-component system nitrate/nitrite response regulator NarP
VTLLVNTNKTMQTETRQKIAIADKNPIIRTGLVDIINRDGRFEIVAAVATGAAFLDLTAQRQIDIGVIGWALPDMTGGDVLREIKRRASPARIIVYTGEPGRDVLCQTIRSGAWGFISKSDEPAVLVETICSVARGRVCFPYVDLEALSHDPLDVLTVRERELLAALANGWSNLQIASRIGISRNTVKYHLKNLYDKLGVRNRAMAVALYMSSPGERRAGTLAG